MIDRKARTTAPSAKDRRPLRHSWGALLLAAVVLAQAAHATPSTRNVFGAAGTCRALLGVNGGAFEPPATDAVLTAHDGSDPSGKKRRKVKKKVKRRRQEIPAEVGTDADAAAASSASPPHMKPIATPLQPPKNSATSAGDVNAVPSSNDIASVKSEFTSLRPPKSNAKAKNIIAPTKAKEIKVAKEKKRPIGGGKEGACLRRIKREWKDAVELGVAYDWGKGRTVSRKKKSKSESNAIDPRTNAIDPGSYNYVRMGPMGRNILQWHFSVQGTPNSVYEKGVYHGRILLPKDFPLSPPRVQMMTPSGRFIPGHDICLSASSYHPESWTPRWTILSLIDALRLHMLTSAKEIGGQHASDEQRRKRALESRSWTRGVVCHEEMLNDGIFSLEPSEEEKEDFGTDENDEKIVEKQPELAPTPPTPEEILGMVTEEAVKRHSERTMKAAVKRHRERTTKAVARRTLKPVLVVKCFLYSVLLLLRGVISVLKSPIKMAIMTLMVIFAYLNRPS